MSDRTTAMPGQGGFVRSMLAGHSALGIAFAALIHLVCFSGLLAVFHAEFARWEQPDAPLVTALQPQAAEAALHGVAAKAAADDALHDLLLIAPGRGLPRLAVNYHDHDSGKEGDWYADAEGRLVMPEHLPWTDFMLRQHYDFHARPWGMYLVGIIGVALLSLLISGILSHPRILRDAFHLRWGGSRRLQDADLHNRLSVWGLPFHLAVALTGAFLGLSGLVVNVLAYAAYGGDTTRAIEAVLGPQPGQDASPAPLPAIVPLLAQVQAQTPGDVLSYIQLEHAGQAGQMVVISAQAPDQLARPDTYSFDGAGVFLHRGGYDHGVAGMQVLAAMQPLHFGSFGGLPVKLAYGVLGLALCLVTSTGITIWLARRRDRGDPAPGWERVWTAVFWGQPVAFAVTALAVQAADLPPLPVFWAVTLLTLVTAIPALEARRLARRLRAVTGGLLLAVALLHGVRWQGIAIDPAAWIMDGVLVAMALAMGLSLGWGRDRAGRLAPVGRS
ncbi:PepSY-associated TM helix domain-containing protein [Oleisolibacter albus]|uniref:PepSY-associated TM helix domain-containing protein n=1 Tax=Oleisolibacter albus TaxID=2171757 RepID=UPI0013906521|nr:PepSY-associated TM helix domain-containing protein [Oleisolibacter albus]